MPNKSVTYINETTFGLAASEARSVASANPAVCVVCNPAPIAKNAAIVATVPAQAGAFVGSVNTMSANGITAKPPYCSIVPTQIYGTRRQPKTDLC